MTLTVRGSENCHHNRRFELADGNYMVSCRPGIDHWLGGIFSITQVSQSPTTCTVQPFLQLDAPRTLLLDLLLESRAF
jgi:hypothetical protein